MTDVKTKQEFALLWDRTFLRAKCIIAGLSQRAIADVLHVGEDSVNDWFSGARRPSATHRTELEALIRRATEYRSETGKTLYPVYRRSQAS